MHNSTIPGHPYLRPKNHASKGMNPQMHMGGNTGVMPHLTVDHMQRTFGSPNMKLGMGGRFAAGKKAIMAKGLSAKSAGAIMASAGRKKYGAAKMAKWSAAGRKRAM